jgi:hypothetical protein
MPRRLPATPADRRAAARALYDGSGGESLLQPPRGLLAGAELATPGGMRRVETIAAGDVVIGDDGHRVGVLATSARHYALATLARQPALRPVLVAAGAFGTGLPGRDLRLAPGQPISLFGSRDTAGRLVNGESIRRCDADGDVIYISLALGDPGALAFGGVVLEAAGDPPPARAGLALRRAAHAALGLALGAPEGRIETADHGRVAGWAYQPEHPDAPVALEITVDGVAVAWCVADRRRPDLETHGIGNGACAFHVPFSPPLPRGRGAVIEVRRATDGLRLDGATVLLPAEPARPGLAATLAGLLAEARGAATKTSLAAVIAGRLDHLVPSAHLHAVPNREEVA